MGERLATKSCSVPSTDANVLVKERLNTKAHALPTDMVEMDIMPDHGHLLLQCDPPFGIHRVVKPLKGDTSHVLFHEFSSLKRRLPSWWANSYVAATRGTAQLEGVKRTIEDERGQ